MEAEEPCPSGVTINESSGSGEACEIASNFAPSISLSTVSPVSSPEGSRGLLLGGDTLMSCSSNASSGLGSSCPISSLSQDGDMSTHSPSPVKRSHHGKSDVEPAAKKPSIRLPSPSSSAALEDVSSDESDDKVFARPTDDTTKPYAACPITSTPGPTARHATSKSIPVRETTNALPCSSTASASSLSGDPTSSMTTVEPVRPGPRKSGHFIRQQIVQDQTWREETESHAVLGPVVFRTDCIKPTHNKEHELPLPDNWIEIMHISGAPVYMDRNTRVCTWARPYYLGPHSARKHAVPSTAIPCLSEALSKGKVDKEILRQPDPDFVNGAEQAKAATAAISGASAAKNEDLVVAVPTVDPENMTKYFSGMWELNPEESNCICRHCRVKLDNKPDDGESDGEFSESKASAQKQDPMGELQPDGSLFFRVGRKGGTYLNTAGKTPLSVLNEYCQRVLHVRPEFTSQETDDPKAPFTIVVSMNNIQYGVGNGSSKKIAKQLAAEVTLQAVNPLLAKRLEHGKDRKPSDINDAFGDMPIDDPGISQLCVEVGMPRPSQVLAECLRRNQNSKPMECDLRVEVAVNRSARYIMTCGEHTVEGKCVNRKAGRQVASQAMLKLLHPHILTWSSLLSLYCDKNSLSITQHPVDDKEDSEMNEVLTSAHVNSKVERGQEVLTELRRRMKRLIPAADSGRPLDPSKVRVLHDFKAPSVHTTQAPTPLIPPSRPERSRSGSPAPPSDRRRASSDRDGHGAHHSSSRRRSRSPDLRRSHDRQDSRDRRPHLSRQHQQLPSKRRSSPPYHR